MLFTDESVKDVLQRILANHELYCIVLHQELYCKNCTAYTHDSINSSKLPDSGGSVNTKVIKTEITISGRIRFVK